MAKNDTETAVDKSDDYHLGSVDDFGRVCTGFVLHHHLAVVADTGVSRWLGNVLVVFPVVGSSAGVFYTSSGNGDGGGMFCFFLDLLSPMA